MTLKVESPGVYTSQGVPISVTGIAQVKVQGQNEEMLLAACEQFLGKDSSQIRRVALETLEGHQRAIMGSMTVEVNGHYQPYSYSLLFVNCDNSYAFKII